MNPAHLHLMLNHIPVIGSVIALGLFASSLIWQSDAVKKAALWLFLLVSLTALPVYFSGEPAEEQIENRPEISKPLIEAHEEAAEAALGSVLALGAAAGGLLFFCRNRTFPRWMPPALLILSLITVGLMARAANHGGQISHPEIRKTS